MSYVQISKESFEYLKILKSKYPHYFDLLESIETGLNLRLWNRISDDLIVLTEKSDLKQSQDLITLYSSLIMSVESTFNPMKLMLIIQNVIVNYSGIINHVYSIGNMEEALVFLGNLEQRLNQKGEEKLFLRILKGFCFLNLNRLYECEEIIKSMKVQLEKSFEVDQIIYSNYYKLSAFFSEKRQDYDEFYNNSLQFLAYVKEGVRLYFNL